MSDKAYVYKDKVGEFRWRRRSESGEIVGASTEGYENEQDARDNYAIGNTGPDAPELEQASKGTRVDTPSADAKATAE